MRNPGPRAPPGRPGRDRAHGLLQIRREPAVGVRAGLVGSEERRSALIGPSASGLRGAMASFLNTLPTAPARRPAMRCLLILAHPRRDSLCGALFDACAAGAREAGVECRELI